MRLRERVYYPNLGPPDECVCDRVHTSNAPRACPCVYCHGIEARPGMGTADAPGDWAEPAVRVLERVNDYELSRDGGWRQAARIVELALEAAYEAGRRADT